MPVKIEELKADIAELRNLLETASRAKVRDVLSTELRKMETILISLKEAADKNPPSASASASSNPPKTSAVIPTEKLRDYAWDQSDKFVKFYLTVPGVQNLDANLIALTVTETGCSLTISAPDKTRIFSIEKLLENVVVEESHHKVKTDSIVILLKKKKSGNWPFITKTEKNIKEARDAKFKPEIESDDPSKGLMSMMKKLYEEGDDEMKRSIAKAWSQSRDGGASSTMEGMDFP
ncbi:calcyclin-binding protein [Galendromus occidentalis]|uniref:Calcyclin-binding protein n=1 Tax=Galendromus occidentalis TaxID=34638 RepID=A0AAJ6QT91_9ACAR|nr:calcyclin-binding protein [Galendromus occidentalis]